MPQSFPRHRQPLELGDLSKVCLRVWNESHLRKDCVLLHKKWERKLSPRGRVKGWPRSVPANSDQFQEGVDVSQCESGFPHSDSGFSFYPRICWVLWTTLRFWVCRTGLQRAGFLMTWYLWYFLLPLWLDMLLEQLYSLLSFLQSFFFSLSLPSF